MHADLQREFARALLDPARPAPAGLRGAPDDRRRRFAVHRNNVAVALVDALAQAFPVTRALLGDTCFRAVARDFAAAEPPRSPVLLEYGDGLPAFLASCAPLAGLPYLADVARLEAMRTRAFHAADAEPLPADAYRMLAEDPARLARTRVSLHPACRWLSSRHAVLSIWAAHQTPPDSIDAGLSALDVDRPEAVLVTRPQLDVRVHALPAGGAALLDLLQTGRTLGDAMAGACALDAQARPAALFGLLVSHGLAIALHSEPEA